MPIARLASTRKASVATSSFLECFLRDVPIQVLQRRILGNEFKHVAPAEPAWVTQAGVDSADEGEVRHRVNRPPMPAMVRFGLKLVQTEAIRMLPNVRGDVGSLIRLLR